MLSEPNTPGLDLKRDAPETAGMARADVRRAAAEKRIQLAPLRRRAAEAEAAIARITQDLARIDKALAEPGLFARDAAKAASLSKMRAEAADALAQAEDDWLAASSEIEAAMT